MEFWSRFLRATVELTGSAQASLCIRTTRADPTGGEPIESWRLLASFPAGGASVPDAGILGQALAEGLARDERDLVFALAGEEAAPSVVVLTLREGAEIALPLSELAALLGAVPELWQSGRAQARLRERLGFLGAALEMGLILGAEEKFAAAVFALCNELAARLKADRVSLGWADVDAIRLRGMSQADKFDARTDYVRDLEVAMEETADQEEELRWPAPEAGRAVVREHGHYARRANAEHLCSLPLWSRRVSAPAGVLLLERGGQPFSDTEVELLRVIGDQVGPRLGDLREKDRAWPVRLWRGLRARAAALLGPWHTGAKLAGAAGALGVLFLLFGRLPYAVEAPA
ncbi:MAG: GAF domain-containing protein, partial [Opitutales bacterium]